jgi:hypothetical protein
MLVTKEIRGEGQNVNLNYVTLSKIIVCKCSTNLFYE